ncbi:MAG TPA: YraN family protein [Hellea balneolensis]|uniref:UPF0102 protein ENJ42_03895 n=1 Tax=Hellea balneolensis TaxID=287478 RepID=A0A7C5LWM2_9PROT|nr:YraN family protein [Hellea balneolensis]
MTPRPNRKRAEKQGRRAEFLAALLLQAKGYKILARRYKTGAGEIDIVARTKSTVVFVEVKARTDLQTAEKSLFPQMQKRIENASDIFMARTLSVQKLTMRYDAIFVLPGFLGIPKFVHRKDAWRAW